MSALARPRFLIDCDGVAADFSGGFLDAIEEETGERFNHSVITTWDIVSSPFFQQLNQHHRHLKDHVWRRVNRIGWCAALKPIEGAREGIDFLRTIGDVEFVTSPLDSSPTWMPERKEWLKRHFDVHHKDVHFVEKKDRVYGDLLLDDKPSHCLSWRRAWHLKMEPLRPWYPFPAILFDQPYNIPATPEEAKELARETWRAKGWERVISLVKMMFIDPPVSEPVPNAAAADERPF